MTKFEKSQFLILFKGNENDFIVIKTDSIVEVWHDEFERTVTVVYRHPTRDELIEHVERYKSLGGSLQRFFIILNTLGIMWQMLRFKEVCRSEKITEDDYE